MKRSSYGERDYAFGKLMLRLRTSIRLTQAGLAGLLGISRQALGEWGSGSSYPKAEHLKYVIALDVRASAFTAGLEEEEIRTLWRAAHQKVLLDELWLHELLSQQAHPRVDVAGEQIRGDDRVSAPPASGGPRVDWGEALDVPSFYGREGELALLSRWVVEERCRVVSVLGMGGIGKSALAVTVMHRVAAHFEVVIWRSLRDAPTCVPPWWRSACKCWPRSRCETCPTPWKDACVCCWSSCALGGCSWCWITWRCCWRKGRARAACGQALRGMPGSCDGWARRRIRVACC